MRRAKRIRGESKHTQEKKSPRQRVFHLASCRKSLRFAFLGQLVKLSRWFQWPQHPVRPASAVRRVLISRAGHLKPLLIDLARFLSVDVDVAITIRTLCLAHAHGLVPTMHSRNRIGMNREGQVLMHANI